MKILTTSDLAYVSGGDSENNPGGSGGGWYDDGESCQAGYSPEQQAENKAYVQGLLDSIDNGLPTAAALAAAALGRWLASQGRGSPTASPNYFNAMGDFN